MTKPVRQSDLEEALKPFALIADAYDRDELKEARRTWTFQGVDKLDLDKVLYSDQEGRCLFRLRDVLKARSVLHGSPYHPDSED